MKNRYTCAVIGAVVLSAAMPASSTGQTTTPATITLVGCLQTEADYRRAQDAGKGGVLMTGAGLGNEYVLIQTEGAGGPGGYDANANADCKSSTAFAGTAYELTGTRERELKAFVGRRVEITGELKNADDTGRPGGFDPAVVSQDLRLNEVNVASFREPAMTTQASTAAQAPPAAQPSTAVQASTAATQTQTQPTEPAQPATSGTSGQAQPSATMASAQTELPRTASPLALYGILGLFSLGGAIALRFARAS
jgi:hypothetical protein